MFVRPRYRRAFSLVELLVVIGVIALLIAMLLPALSRARAQARQTQCASQLRQVGQALFLYANGNGGYLPAWSGWHTYPDGANADDQPGPAWTEQLAPSFVKPDSAVYNCPGYSPADPPRINYFLAARWSASRNQHAMKLTDVRMTSRFVLSGDMTNATLYPGPFGQSEHVLDDCDKDDAVLPSLCFPYQAGGFWMHARGNNVLFDDGHVAAFGEFDPGAMTYDATSMRGWDEVLPVPGR
jgi:prepilin-type N-terminal cleavage/methylation domain-containing protein